MTSTEFTVGLVGTRISSKVLKPPGGGSSDIFGVGSAKNTSNGTSNDSQKVQNTSTQSRLFGDSGITSSPIRVQKDSSKSNIFGNEAPALKRTAQKPYVRRNPITGEEIVVDPEHQQKEENGESEEENNVETNGETKEENNVEINGESKAEKSEAVPPAKPVQTSIRVRAPPGGKSSIIF